MSVFVRIERSCLEPMEACGSDFLFDSRPAFGWADGNEDASGEGESLTLSFEEYLIRIIHDPGGICGIAQVSGQRDVYPMSTTSPVHR